MNNSHTKSLNQYLKLYAVEAEMTMKEVREELAAVLGISRDMTYKYSKGSSKMDVAKIRQTVSFLSQYVAVSEENLTEWFYPTLELTQTAEA
jgi:hypothetical protein